MAKIRRTTSRLAKRPNRAKIRTALSRRARERGVPENKVGPVFGVWQAVAGILDAIADHAKSIEQAFKDFDEWVRMQGIRIDNIDPLDVDIARGNGFPVITLPETKPFVQPKPKGGPGNPYKDDGGRFTTQEDVLGPHFHGD